MAKLIQKRRRAKAAAKLPAYLRDYAARKGGRPRLRGSFGPAGPVTITTPTDAPKASPRQVESASSREDQ